MMDAVTDAAVILSAVRTGEYIIAQGAWSMPLLRITLEEMLPWIMIWIAVAGILRLFTGGGPSDPDGSR
jgi:hypothetical protein